MGSKIIRSEVIKELEILKREKTIFDFKTDGKIPEPFLSGWNIKS